MFKFINKSKTGEQFFDLAQGLYGSIKSELGFTDDPSVTVVDDDDNMKNSLGKTAYYEPSTQNIVLYCSGRHIKDILRSFAHELIHHDQNCNGKFSGNTEMADGYAQNDEFLREMEKEAYLKGNMHFRDWEDKKKMNESQKDYIIKEDNKKMKKRLNRPNDSDDFSASRHKKDYTAQKISERLGWKRPRLDENCDMAGGGVEMGAQEEEEETPIYEEEEIEEANPNLGLWDAGVDEQSTREAVVKHDNALNEYVVKFYKEGKYLSKSDYRTSNKQEAFDTKSHYEKQ